MALDDPLAVLAGEGRARHKDCAAIDQVAAVVNADHASPGTLADERPQARFAKHRRKDIPVRGRVLIEYSHHRAEEHPIGISTRCVVGALVVKGQDLSPQTLNQHARDITAPIGSYVYDQAFFLKL